MINKVINSPGEGGNNDHKSSIAYNGVYDIVSDIALQLMITNGRIK